MKIIVDYDLCEANAICEGESSAVFKVEEDDTLTLLSEEVPSGAEEAVREAVRLCPRQALRIIE